MKRLTYWVPDGAGRGQWRANVDGKEIAGVLVDRLAEYENLPVPDLIAGTHLEYLKQILSVTEQNEPAIGQSCFYLDSKVHGSFYWTFEPAKIVRCNYSEGELEYEIAATADASRYFSKVVRASELKNVCFFSEAEIDCKVESILNMLDPAQIDTNLMWDPKKKQLNFGHYQIRYIAKIIKWPFNLYADVVFDGDIRHLNPDSIPKDLEETADFLLSEMDADQRVYRKQRLSQMLLSLYKNKQSCENIIDNIYANPEWGSTCMHRHVLLREVQNGINYLSHPGRTEIMRHGLSVSEYKTPLPQHNIVALRVNIGTCNRLANLNIKTIQDLLNRTEAELSSIEGIGCRTIKELKKQMERFGFTFKLAQDVAPQEINSPE